MASGMPVVTTESSGMTDVVEDSHDGLFVIPEMRSRFGGDRETLPESRVAAATRQRRSGKNETL